MITNDIVENIKFAKAYSGSFASLQHFSIIVYNYTIYVKSELTSMAPHP